MTEPTKAAMRLARAVCNEIKTIAFEHGLVSEEEKVPESAITDLARRVDAEIKLPQLITVAKAADEYLREHDNPAPDYIRRRFLRDMIRETFSALGEIPE